MLCGILGMWHQLDGLHHVGVATDDVVDSLLDELLGEVALFVGRLLLVLVAPMHDGNDDIRIHGTCSVYVGR